MKPNVVLIVLDAARADHFSSYGYSKMTTPYMDQIAREGALFLHAYSPSNWTVPSHASIFTGMHVKEHGANAYTKYLTDSKWTIAQELKAIGYKTISISANPWICESTGLVKGFDVVLNPQNYLMNEKYDISKIFHRYQGNPKMILKNFLKNFFSRKGRINDIINLFYFLVKDGFDKKHTWNGEAKNVFEAFYEEINLVSNEKLPFFMFLNFMETHQKYWPPSSFRKNEFKGIKKSLIRNINQDAWINHKKFPNIDAFSLDILKRLYDGELKYVDTVIKNIYIELKKRKLLENTILIITSDHGELFGEGGNFAHMPSLHNRLLNVPLIIRFPPLLKRNTLINYNVTLTGLYNTLKQILNVRFHNHSSAPSLLIGKDASKKNPPIIYNECIGSQTDVSKYGLSPSDYNMIIECCHVNEYKLVIKNKEKMLYDLKEDPDEQNNIYWERNEIAERITKQLQHYKKNLKIVEKEKCYNRPTNRGKPKMTLAMKERLQSLGYL